MNGTIDLSLVPSFVEVVRLRSFTQAAHRLGVPKSTVSRRVARLEAELGVQLLVRTTRQLRLTDAGEQFYGRVVHVVESVEEAARAVAELQDAPQGRLRITVPSDLERLPTLVSSFVTRYPDVTVHVNATARFVDLVAEGYDLAIRAGQLQDSTLIARRLATVEMHVFASHAYLEAHGAPRTLDDLRDHSAVLFRAQQRMEWPLIGPEGLSPVEVTGSIASDDLLFVRGAVLAGAGLGLLPRHIFASDRNRVRRVLPDYRLEEGAIHLVYPAARHVPAKVRAFRDHMLASLPWYPESTESD